MLVLLLGKDWTVNRREVLSRVASDVKSKKRDRIVIVPELISHEMERKLCEFAGDTASRYAEVISFSRLVRRVSDYYRCNPEACLDPGGRLVAMASVARQLSSKLKAYAAVESRPEFLEGLVEGVDEFKRCCIHPQDLLAAAGQTEGSLAQKLEELALLMDGYDGLCSHGMRDPRDQMTWLLEQMEQGDFGREHTFYIDGFPDFTRQHLAVLEHLIIYSPLVTVSLNCDSIASKDLAFEKAGDTASKLYTLATRAGIEVRVEYVQEETTQLRPVRDNLFQGSITAGCAKGVLYTYQVDSVWDECLGAANMIRDLVRSGCRYRDITLVCTDSAPYFRVLELVFSRMRIPLYRSGTEDILQKSIVSTVLCALDAALGGLEQKEVIRYLRSALSPLQRDACDELENYAITWGIRGHGWISDWTNHPDGLSGIWDDVSRKKILELNTWRATAVDPLEKMRTSFRKASDLGQQVHALYAFLEDIDLQNKLELFAKELDDVEDKRESQILGQLWEILLTALEQMYDVLGNTYWDPEHFSRLLRLLLSQYDVGTIPPVLDAVQVGQVSAMRCHEQKHLILLGAQEGSFPGYPGSSGLLTDQERVTLRGLGVPLTGGAMEGIQAEFAEIYGVICGASESIRVFCSGDQPSFVFRRLAKMAGGNAQADSGLDYALSSHWEAGAWLARWNALEAAKELDVLEGYTDTVRRKAYSLGRVERDRIDSLYGKTLNLSASQIDRQAECRMSYFLKYGLRLQERKEATVDPAEFGTYVHAVLENTARCIRDMGGFRAVSLEQTLELAHRFSEEYANERFGQLSSERLTYLFRRNIQELDMVVRELWEELKDASFEPKDFEVNFGGSEDLPAIPIPNGKMNALLRGFVDRVDTWSCGGSSYYRVVDYKTGRKDFDYCDVFNGVGLQMLLYMFALKQSGEELLGTHPTPAGVQYFPARSPYLATDGLLSEEEAEKERQSQWKRKGILLRDEAVLQAMEPGDDPKRMNYTVKKDGSLSGDLADREQLKQLESYVFRVVGKLVEDIASGNVEANPYTRGSSHDACAFCPYGSICHKSEITQRRNYKAMSAQRFWDEIEKELTRHVSKTNTAAGSGGQRPGR